MKQREILTMLAIVAESVSVALVDGALRRANGVHQQLQLLTRRDN